MRKEHSIKWWVVVGGKRQPRQATMRGSWDYEATCSCGWETRTGGAVRSHIEAAVRDHKWDVAHGFITPNPTR